MTGYDTAIRLLHAGGAREISVGMVSGSLTDHYDPKHKTVNLSETTYGDASVAAVAVAAHEIGHVMQKKEGFAFYKLRTALVPVTNIGSYLAIPLVIIGFLLEVFVSFNTEAPIGFYVALGGVALYGLSTLFALVTLPVELDASRRAKAMLVDQGIVSPDEKRGASKVLRAAAFTYVAGLFTSLVYFLRFLLWVSTMFGNRRRR